MTDSETTKEHNR